MKTAATTTIVGLVLIASALLAAKLTASGEARGATRLEAFERLDRDRDGRISLHEAESNAGLATHFRKFDRDDDGTLDRGEFLTHEAPISSGG